MTVAVVSGSLVLAGILGSPASTGFLVSNRKWSNMKSVAPSGSRAFKKPTHAIPLNILSYSDLVPDSGLGSEVQWVLLKVTGDYLVQGQVSFIPFLSCWFASH